MQDLQSTSENVQYQIKCNYIKQIQKWIKELDKDYTINLKSLDLICINKNIKYLMAINKKYNFENKFYNSIINLIKLHIEYFESKSNFL